MVGDVSAAAAWVAIVTALCACITACVRGYFAHERKVLKMKQDAQATIRYEQSMLSGEALELALTKAKLDLLKEQGLARYRY